MRTSPPSTSWSTSLSPRPSMSMRAARGEVQQRLLALRRAEEPAGAARDRLVLVRGRPPSRTPGTCRASRTSRAFVRGAVPRTTRDDLRDHVAGAAHDDRVADFQMSLRRISSSLCSVALVTVSPPTNTGFSRATGVSAPVRPTWTSMSCELGGRLLAPGTCARPPSAARARRSRASLWRRGVHLVDHAVDVVGKRRARFARRAA